MAVNALPGGPNLPNTPMLDDQGRMSFAWLKFFQYLIKLLQDTFTELGIFNGTIGATATVQGRTGTLSSAIQHLTPTGSLQASALTGVVAAAQLPAALPAVQGAVVLPVGAPSNTLGSAAFEDSSAFDAAGSAAAAQAAAQTFATAQANAALSAANTYTDGKFPGVTAHTIPLAKLTVGGSNGSLTFNANGVITGFVDPT